MKNIFINPQERRLRSFWRILALFFVFFSLTFGAQLVLGIGLGIGIALGVVDLSGVTDLGAYLSANMWVLAYASTCSLAVLLACFLGAAFFLDRRPLRDFGFHWSARWFADLAFGLFLGAFLMGAVFAVELAAGWVRVEGVLLQAADPMFWVGLLVFAWIFFCVGIYEEMLDRGYLMRNLAEGLRGRIFGPKPALLAAYLLSSAIFGAMHMLNPNTTLVSTLSLMVAGLFLGFGYLLTGELAIPIGLHMTWNFFQGNVFGFPVSGIQPSHSIVTIVQGGPEAVTGGAFGPEAGLIGLAAIALGFLLTAGWVAVTRKGIRLHKELTEYQPTDPAAAPQ